MRHSEGKSGTLHDDNLFSLCAPQWNLYICLVEAMLGSKFTLNSYAELMVGNMTEPEKAKILKIIADTQQKQDGNDVIKQAQQAWDAYFDAEYEVSG